jgi:hypothetical protein
MVQRGIGDKRVTMGGHMEVALSGVMVSSTAGTTKFMRIFTLKIARWVDGADDFYSICMRSSLRVY